MASFAALCVSAQDMLARQAPTDRRMKACDSLAIQELRLAESTTDIANIEENDLYKVWSNSGVYIYGKTPLPDTYKIDLRGFVMPTPSRNVTSRYGYRASFKRNHYGLDIKVYTGDTIVSAWDGKVRVVKSDPNGWGNYVVVRHPNGIETLYAHMSKHLVKENQIVKAGEPVGLGGNTGRSTGSHLHLECRILGEAINPELLFDFPHQDVTGDYYVWHNTNKSRSRGGSAVKTPEELEDKPKNVAAATPTTTTTSAEAPVNAVPTTRNERVYQVEAGDTPYSISRKLNVPLDELYKANGMAKGAHIRVGQLLKY